MKMSVKCVRHVILRRLTHSASSWVANYASKYKIIVRLKASVYPNA
jgi:hypothetical protein